MSGIVRELLGLDEFFNSLRASSAWASVCAYWLALLHEPESCSG